MKSIRSARMLVNKKRASFSSSSSSIMMDAAKEELATLSIVKEPAVHFGKMKVSVASLEPQRSGAGESLHSVVFTIGASGVNAVAEPGQGVVHEASYEEMKEIVWDHSEKSVKFAMLDGQTSPTFFFKALSLRRPEHACMGVLAGKTLSSPIQQRRFSTSLVNADAHQIALPASKRRELLHQERPVRNATTCERLGMEYFRNGYLSFTCSINNDLRGLKLDLNYTPVSSEDEGKPSLYEASFSSLTSIDIEMVPGSPVPILDLSPSPVPLLESPLFARSGRFDSTFPDTAQDETAHANGGDDGDDDSDRFVSFGYLGCDVFEAPDTIDGSTVTCEEATLDASSGSRLRDQRGTPSAAAGESVLSTPLTDDCDTRDPSGVVEGERD